MRGGWHRCPCGRDVIPGIPCEHVRNPDLPSLVEEFQQAAERRDLLILETEETISYSQAIRARLAESA